MPGTTPNIGLTYQALGDAADIETAVKVPLLQLDAMRLARRALPLSAQQVLEVGQTGQIRAGRQLANADFTNMGLAAPLALYNLSDLTDASGNARTLTNKGTVPFGVGINGSAATAAQFTGSTAQALYIVSAAWQQIKTGSWGCWFRTAKRGVNQGLIAKASVASQGWFLEVSSSNVVRALASSTGAASSTMPGFSDVADDRWHFAVCTLDGTTVRVYVDGALENFTAFSGALFASTGPLNIGAYYADASTVASQPTYGRIDEAFLTSDVLSDDQVRNLYCASITHGLTDISAAALTPRHVDLKVRRRRRGGNLVSGDFPSAPVRLHTFTGGVYTDAGSGGVTLTPNPGTGAIVDVADADGSAGGAKSLSGLHTGLSSTDAGLPATTTSRSFGTWFKINPRAATDALIAWGTNATAHAGIYIDSAGAVNGASAGDTIVAGSVRDGAWHLAVEVDDNTAADGVKRKLYLDGRLIGGSTVLNSITLAGANRFRVGAYPDGSLPLTGIVDDAFVIAVALTAEQVRTLYNKGSQALAASPKSEGDHIEAMESTRLLAVFDSLEGVDQIDLEVTA